MPQGGVARRATQIRTIRDAGDRPVLVLDAGSALLGETYALESEGRVIVEAMNAMGYDAMAVGLMDLAKGVDVLLARAEEAEFAILSANLVSLADGETLLPPYTIIEREGVRYGVLGVTEPDAVAAPGVSAVAEVLDPAEAVRRYLPEVQAQSDVVILLSHLGLEEDVALAEQVPGIPVIVGGRTRTVLTEPTIVGEMVIVQMGYDGEWLGRLEVTIDGQGRPVEPTVEVVSLGPEVADDPEAAAIVDTWARRLSESAE